MDLRILWGWQHLEVQAWAIVRGGLGDFMEVQVNRGFESVPGAFGLRNVVLYQRYGLCLLGVQGSGSFSRFGIRSGGFAAMEFDGHGVQNSTFNA